MFFFFFLDAKEFIQILLLEHLIPPRGSILIKKQKA